jgi:hypothetical protein
VNDQDKELGRSLSARGGTMIGVLLIIFGVLGITGAIFAKDFWAADVIALHEFKQKLPTWLGRFVCAVAGAGLIAVGVKMLIGRG